MFKGISVRNGVFLHNGPVILFITNSIPQIGDIAICESPSKAFEIVGNGDIICDQNRHVKPVQYAIGKELFNSSVFNKYGFVEPSAPAARYPKEVDNIELLIL